MKTKPSRWWDLLSAILLLATLGTVALRLRVTDWTANLGVIETLTALGCLLGLALGYSRFGSGWARVFGLVFTAFFIPLELGLLFEKSSVEWLDRLNNLYARLYWSLADFFQNKPVQDPLLFVTVMAIFFWIVAILAGYQLTRHGRPWAPVIIIGLAMLIIDFYTPYTEFRDRYSAVFVFFVLFLLARLYYLHSRKDWNDRGATVDPEVGFDMGRSVAISGLILILAAWNIPTLVDALTPGTDLQRELARQWETTRDKLQNAVAGLQGKAIATNDFFGSDLALGVGGTRDEENVFSVTPTLAKLPVGVRFYWRARSYDTYNGAQWSSTLDTLQSVGADEWPFTYPDWKGRKVVDISVTMLTNSVRNFYLPALPLSISKPADVLGKKLPDGTFDFVGALATPALRSGEIVHARTWVDAPTIADLRTAISNFSPPIRSTYLQLPANFNRRIRSLAVQITASSQTQYDRVVAITNWLRSNITYKEVIDNPPAGIDPIEWFLFDYKHGFCNYYASAEVLLLRSIGIPARLAVGYAEGEYDETKNTFTIRRRDSHAWPEVYFEGYGWVEFEPTTAQPQTSLLESAPATPATTVTPEDPSAQATRIALGELRAEQQDAGPGSNIPAPVSPVLVVVLPILGVSLLIGMLLLLQRRGKLKIFRTPLPVMIENNLERRGWSTPGWLAQWAHLARLSPIERMYIQLGWTLPLLGHHTRSNQTPAERLAELSHALPEAAAPLGVFLGEYEHAEYSPYPFDVRKARQANLLIWQQALRAIFRRLVGAT